MIMNHSDEYYIKLCIKQIEKKFSFEQDDGSLQRNLELLSKKINEQTGITISLSTLKRIWKSDFKQRPQTVTLNALAAVLHFSDWQNFKDINRNKLRRVPPQKRNIIFSLFFVMCLIIVLFLSFLPKQQKPDKIKINGNITFSAQKTLLCGVPNTVIFDYDVSNVEADSFSFQQSWNDYHRGNINPKEKAISSIYYESGYHRAYLLANDSFIAVQPVHILSKGWEPHIYYNYEDKIPIYLDNEGIISNGTLHISKSQLNEQNVDLSRDFFTRIVNSREFKVSSDNFNLMSRIKLDSLQYSECPWINLIVVTEKNVFTVVLQNKGCEYHAYYKLGEIERNGSTNNLSALGCNIYQWQELGIHVLNRNATISINGENVFSEKYKEDFGDIKSLIYIFERTGSIDFVKLSDTEGNVKFEDTF